LTKYVLVYILGKIFIESSGHPDQQVRDGFNANPMLSIGYEDNEDKTPFFGKKNWQTPPKRLT
jgi:hypothetical protein